MRRKMKVEFIVLIGNINPFDSVMVWMKLARRWKQVKLSHDGA